MLSITIKNIPNPLYQKIKKSSQQNRRSINAEIIYCLEEKLLLTTSNNISLEQIRSTRSIGKRHLLTQEDIENAKNEGRFDGEARS
jgi:antitoxin FitA